MRILAAMLKHETNTFSPVPTDLARFRAWGLYEGEAVGQAYRGTNHPLAAYLDLADERGIEIATPVAAEAMPSGLVEREAYEYLTGLILDALRTGGFDGARARTGGNIGHHADRSHDDPRASRRELDEAMRGTSG